MSDFVTARAGAPPMELGNARAWFFADLHLRADTPDEVRAFADSVNAVPEGVDALVVMGDLFDAWAGPRQWKEPAFQPLVDAFRAISARGVRVLLLRGNRDVLLGPRDGRIVSAEVTDSLLFDGEERLLVTHGDEFCLRDAPYQRLRRTLRNPFLRAAVRILPYGVSVWVGRRLRKASQGSVARKPLDSQDLVEEAVSAALDRWNAKVAMIGHLHVAEERSLPQGRRLRILPAWEPGSAPVKWGPALDQSIPNL